MGHRIVGCVDTAVAPPLCPPAPSPPAPPFSTALRHIWGLSSPPTPSFSAVGSFLSPPPPPVPDLVAACNPLCLSALACACSLRNCQHSDSGQQPRSADLRGEGIRAAACGDHGFACPAHPFRGKGGGDSFVPFWRPSCMCESISNLTTAPPHPCLPPSASFPPPLFLLTLRRPPDPAPLPHQLQPPKRGLTASVT